MFLMSEVPLQVAEGGRGRATGGKRPPGKERGEGVCHPHPTPQACTLHSTPYTLHPTPDALHPEPYTPNREPEALNPKA